VILKAVFCGEVKRMDEKKKLYVGSLSFEVTEGDLSALFGEMGSVESVNIFKDLHSGQSKGFAFVEMASEEEAKKAMDKLNGCSLKDRDMVVGEARPRRNSRGLSKQRQFDRF
jgi:RNA recognition motif-containing protein